MAFDPAAEYFIPGTFDPTESWPENVETMHQGGLDQIAPAKDPGIAIGFDPFDIVMPSLATEESVEKTLPQWGPPFVAFVDQRISELERLINASIRDKWQYESQTHIYTGSVQTTGSGGLDQVTTPNCVIFEVNPGFTFALHRLEITLPGTNFNFATPFNGAGAYWELRVNNEARDGGSLVANAPLKAFGLPFVLTYGTRDAIRVRDGEICSLFLNAGPASTKVDIKCQGTLDRVIEG